MNEDAPTKSSSQAKSKGYVPIVARDSIGLPLTDANSLYDFVKDPENCASLGKLAESIITRSNSRQAAKFIAEVFGNGPLSMSIHSVE